MPTELPQIVSRRHFLIGGGTLAGAVLLGACGSDDESSEPLTLAQFFGGPSFVAGQEARAPFGLADADGLLPVDRTPDSVAVSVLGPDGAEVTATEVARHATGLPRAYFPLRFTPPDPGIYTIRSESGGEASEMALKVDAAGDVAVIQPGAALPPIATPTTADAQGIDPICTRDPVCPLHEVSVAEAVGEERPIALLVSTPAFCQVSICGPVLDVLLDRVDAYPDIRFIHAEVYTHPLTDPALEDHAPVISELGLHFEPALVLADADGAVTERLDYIYDRRELDAALSRVS